MDDGINMSMPVAPAYGGANGGFGFGGDWSWIILLLLVCGGGWGGGFGGWNGGFGGMYEFPWLLNGQAAINANTNAGFDHAATQSAIGNLSTAVTAGFGDVQTALCGGFAGVNASITNAQMANMQSLYGVQSALQQCCCDNRAGLADLRYTVATENCADRAALSDGIRDILASQTASTQRILDQLCADKIDAKNDTIAQLRQELIFARGQASQDVQTATLRAAQATTANELLSELRACPIPAQPVYGSTPIFSCQQNACGCGT